MTRLLDLKPFLKGDDIELVDSRSLLVVGKCKVKDAN